MLRLSRRPTRSTSTSRRWPSSNLHSIPSEHRSTICPTPPALRSRGRFSVPVPGQPLSSRSRRAVAVPGFPELAGLWPIPVHRSRQGVAAPGPPGPAGRGHCLPSRAGRVVAIPCLPESAELWQCPVILSAAKDLLSVCCWYRREDPSPALPAQDDKGGKYSSG